MSYKVLSPLELLLHVCTSIPLNTESRAMPQPVAPPPMIRISNSSPARSLAICSDLHGGGEGKGVKGGERGGGLGDAGTERER